MTAGRKAAGNDAVGGDFPLLCVIAQNFDHALGICQGGRVAVGGYAVVHHHGVKALGIEKLGNRCPFVRRTPAVSATGEHHNAGQGLLGV